MIVEALDAAVSDRLERQARAFYRAIPLYLLVPVAFWAVFRWFGIAIDWRMAGIGALGWWLALMLRAPVALLARGLRQDTAKLLVVGASGPLEEGVRVAAVLMLSPALPGALSLGLGWASIEVLFTIVNGLMVVRLLRKDDEQARQARALLESQGTLSGTAPWIGVAERVFASLLHLGFTLVIAAAPLLALAMAPLHSGANLLALRLAPRLGLVLGMLAVVGILIFGFGFALMV